MLERIFYGSDICSPWRNVPSFRPNRVIFCFLVGTIFYFLEKILYLEFTIESKTQAAAAALFINRVVFHGSQN